MSNGCSLLCQRQLYAYSANAPCRVGIAMCLLMQAQIQLGCYIHECTNETHFPAKLQDLIITLASLCFL